VTNFRVIRPIAEFSKNSNLHDQITPALHRRTDGRLIAQHRAVMNINNNKLAHVTFVFIVVVVDVARRYAKTTQL